MDRDNTITIQEYESLTRAKDLGIKGFHTMPGPAFDALETLLLKNQQGDAQASDFLSLSIRRGEKVISAKNYVGLIVLQDGTNIEILPKVAGATKEQTRQIFRDMLSTMRDLPFKSFQKAHLQSDKLSLLEVFIAAFLSETGALIKRGLKHGYVEHAGNERFLKGRLDFDQQIRQNLVRKERFFIEYDEFEINRPENRLIKSALQFVLRKSRDANNLRDCRRYLQVLEEVEPSADPASDLTRCTGSRIMREYDIVLQWCRILLMNRSITMFKGTEVAIALLYPMEQLFESYVAAKLRRALKAPYRITAQDTGYYLFDAPKKQFALRPDIVIHRPDERCVVMDTKWKVLSPYQTNYGISQSDMYQMYAYHKKYKPKEVVLIYPYDPSIGEADKVLEFKAIEGDDVCVKAIFFDLLNVDKSVEWILQAYKTSRKDNNNSEKEISHEFRFS